MTKTDYIALASAFKDALQARKIAWSAATTQAGKDELHNQIVGYIDAVKMVAAVAQSGNDRFNRTTFLDACGIVRDWTNFKIGD